MAQITKVVEPSTYKRMLRPKRYIYVSYLLEVWITITSSVQKNSHLYELSNKGQSTIINTEQITNSAENSWPEHKKTKGKLSQKHVKLLPLQFIWVLQHIRTSLFYFTVTTFSFVVKLHFCFVVTTWNIKVCTQIDLSSWK